MLSRLAVGGIEGYRRYISPWKGFSCAYRVVAGGESCSSYAQTVIAQEGLFRALPLIRDRFHLCSDVVKTEKARRKDRHTPCSALDPVCGLSECGCSVVEALPCRGCGRGRSGGEGCDFCGCGG